MSYLSEDSFVKASASGAADPSSGLFPAPFPPAPYYRPDERLGYLPPKPKVKGNIDSKGMVTLIWNMNLLSAHAKISAYELYAYQDGEEPVTPALWKKVADVRALPLPIKCVLTQFLEGHRYYFAVRAIDIYTRYGQFSDPISIKYVARLGEPCDTRTTL